MRRFASVALVTSLAALGFAPPVQAEPGAQSLVITNRREPRLIPIGSAGGRRLFRNGRHGYIPHPNAYHKRARRRPYKGNLGRRH